MKITKLQLKNFRNHSNTSIDLDRFTFIIGPNAAGKSSIALGIEMLLTGRCAVTDAAGKGADDLVRLGERSFYVAGQVGKSLVERSKGPGEHTIDIAGYSGPTGEMQERIYDGLHVTSDVLSAVLNCGRFATKMTEAEQKKLLAQVLATEAPRIPKEIMEDIRSTNYPDADVVPASVQDIDDAHKYFYSERTELNREMKALGSMELPEIPADMPNVAEIRSKLEGLRSERLKLETDKSRIEGRHDEARKGYAQRKTELLGQIAAACAKMLPDDEAAVLEAIAGKVDQLEGFNVKLKSIDDRIARFTAEADASFREKVSAAKQKAKDLGDRMLALNNSLSTIERIKAASCPACARPLSVNDKKQIVDSLTWQLDDLKKEHRIAQADADMAQPPAGEDVKKLRMQRGLIEADIRELGDIQDAEIQMRAHREAMVEESRCQRELKALQEPAGPDVWQDAGRIEALTERITKGEAILESVSSIEAQHRAYKSWKDKREELAGQVEVLERLIAFFGPNGVKASMVGDKIGPFISAMNEVLRSFGYLADFTLEPYRFRVCRQGSTDVLSIRQLSESEKFRFGVAFQIALAMATGLKFVVIDGADILEPAQRQYLTHTLMTSDLDQAIVLSTSVDVPPAQDVLPPGVKFIQLGGDSWQQNRTASA